MLASYSIAHSMPFSLNVSCSTGALFLSLGLSLAKILDILDYRRENERQTRGAKNPELRGQLATIALTLAESMA